MPYVSKAQQGLFHSKNSPVSKATVKKWDEESRGVKNLPLHVGSGSNASVRDYAISRRMKLMSKRK